MFEGIESADKDPRKSAARRRGRHARAGARRGVRRRHGQLDQLQHGVDLDLRAAADLRVPRAPRQGERSGAPATTCRTTWSAPTPRASCCGSARRCATGSRATGSPCTATTSTTRTRRPTTTRCWPPTSASGASRPTSAAWPTSRWSRPTSSCPSRPTSRGRRRRSTRCATPPATACSSSQHAAGMKQGDAVLVWGATGGLGGYAVQYVLNGGGTPVGVVSSPEKGEMLQGMGCERGDRPQGRRLPVLGRRAPPGRERVAPPRQGHPRADRRRPRHRVRAPRSPDLRRLGVRRRPRRHRSSPARPPAAT